MQKRSKSKAKAERKQSGSKQKQVGAFKMHLRRSCIELHIEESYNQSINQSSAKTVHMLGYAKVAYLKTRQKN